MQGQPLTAHFSAPTRESCLILSLRDLEPTCREVGLSELRTKQGSLNADTVF